MKLPPSKWRLIFVVNLLAALAMPVGMAAQDKPSQDHKPKHKKYKLIDMGTFGGSLAQSRSGHHSFGK